MAGTDPRVQAALDNIQEAQRLLAKAGEELSAVDGFANEWQRISQLYGELRSLWHEVEDRRGFLARCRLELREEEGGPRYYLEGRPVHAGDVLEVLDDTLEDWTLVRFEWSHVLDEPVKLFTDKGEVRLPTTALFRWPSS